MTNQSLLHPHKLLRFLRSNRVAQNGVLNLVGFALPVLIMLVFTPFLVARMGTEGYGLWTISISILGLAGVMELGLGTAVTKYVAQYTSVHDDGVGLSSAATLAVIISVVMGSLTSVALYLTASRVARYFAGNDIGIDSVIRVIQISAWGLLPQFIRNSALAVPMGLQRYGWPVFLKLLQNILVLLVASVCVSLGYQVEGAVLGAVILMWLFGFTSAWLAWEALRPHRLRWHLSRHFVKPMLKYMVAISITGLGSQIFNSLDRIVVGAVLGLSAVTYYTVAVAIANKFLDFSNALTKALLPAASRWYSEGNTLQLRRAFKSSTLATAIMSVLICVFGIWITHPFLRVWMGSEFAAEATGLLQILLIIYALVAINVPSYHIANGIDAAWINAIGAVFGGCAVIILIIMLGHRYGLIGLAVANSGYLVNFIILTYVYRKLRDQDYVARRSSHA